MDKKSVEKTVEVKEPVVEQKVVTPTPVVKVRRKRWGFKLIFWLLVLAIFGGGFMLAGMYVYQEIIPAVEGWLVDHNFRSGNNFQIQNNSPFVPQDTTKNGASMTIPQVVKATSPSVVSIALVSNGNLQPDGTQKANNIGTGFIIDSSGIIVTNQHVVRDTKAEYQVITQDNKTYKPKSIIRDEINDIALIIIDATNLSALKLGNSDQLEVGETVIAIGTPLGEYPGSVTVGVVSGLGRTVVTGDGFWELQKEYENVLQTDAAINPGNSGGPLLSLSGDVIGVNFATTGGVDNISFALPINVVTQKVSEYKQYGKFRSPYLGVSYRMVLAQEAEFYNVKPGALVRAVTDNSPAKTAGLKVGDIITEINGKPVAVSLAASLGKFQVDAKITLTVVRSNLQSESETLTITATLADRPTNQ